MRGAKADFCVFLPIWPGPFLFLWDFGIRQRFLQLWASLVAHLVKNLSAMQETQVRFLGQEDPSGEGNSNPLQYSCLENPMDRGAWWATVHGPQESDTT